MTPIALGWILARLRRMPAVSPRYAPALCVLIALAMVPPLLHTYVPPLNDGLTVDAIPAQLAGFTGAPGGRHAGWLEDFEGTEGIDRVYVSGEGRVDLTVVRTYDAKRLYHHPELALAYGTSFDRAEALHLAGRPDLPVHVLRSRNVVAVYALHYDDGFVERPIWFQLRTAVQLLVSSRQPMTLFFAQQPATPDAVVDSLPAVTVLFAAVDAFLAQPPSASSAESAD